MKTKSPRTLKTCEQCNKVIEKESTRSWADYGKKRFCSYVCYFASIRMHPTRRPLTIVCEQCGKTRQCFAWQVKHSKHLFCSQSCASIFSHIGERNCNWRGGIAQYPDHAYLKRQRRVKLEEVHYQCQLCGNPATIVHHINAIKNDHRLDNLLVLCCDCHWDIERGRKAQTTKYRRLYGLKVAELAKKFGCSFGTIYAWHKRGLLNSAIQTSKRPIQQSHGKSHFIAPERPYWKAQTSKYIREYGILLNEIAEQLHRNPGTISHWHRQGTLAAKLAIAQKERS